MNKINKINILQIGLIIELFITYIFCFFFFNEKVKKIGIITMKEYSVSSLLKNQILLLKH